MFDGVIAKFNLTTLIWIDPDDHSKGADLTFSACIDGEDNKSWSEATPAGQVTMMVTNPAALEHFEANVFKDFYLTFSPVPEPAVANADSPA